MAPRTTPQYSLAEKAWIDAQDILQVCTWEQLVPEFRRVFGREIPAKNLMTQARRQRLDPGLMDRQAPGVSWGR